jgi:hypothetical protein
MSRPCICCHSGTRPGEAETELGFLDLLEWLYHCGERPSDVELDLWLFDSC